VFKLINAGADVNETLKPAGGNHSAKNKSTTPLILAVENGHFELAVALLKSGAETNARPAGYTALHAITWVRKPIRGDPDPPPIGSGNMSSLDTVRQLVTHGADVNRQIENGTSGRGRFTTNGSTPFLLAARASDVPLMNVLRELRADPGISNADKCTPLLAAAGVGALDDGEEAAGTEDEAIETVRVLLDDGADVNAVDETGESAMHGAAYQSRSKLVQILVARSAETNFWNRKNKAGWGQDDDRRKSEVAGFDYDLVKPADRLFNRQIRNVRVQAPGGVIPAQSAAASQLSIPGCSFAAHVGVSLRFVTKSTSTAPGAAAFLSVIGIDRFQVAQWPVKYWVEPSCGWRKRLLSQERRPELFRSY
jgi:ankyrin repeat protein